MQGLPPNEEGYLEDDNLLVPNSKNIETEESEAFIKSNANLKTSNADNEVANHQGIHLSSRTIISHITARDSIAHINYCCNHQSTVCIQT